MSALDHTFFPHLVESILDAAPHDTLLSFRASCKEYKRRADAHLFQRIALLSRPSPAPFWTLLSGALCTPTRCLIDHDEGPCPAQCPGQQGRSLSDTPPSLSSSAASSVASSTAATPTSSPVISAAPSPATSRRCSPAPDAGKRLPYAHGNYGPLANVRVIDLPAETTDTAHAVSLQPVLWNLETLGPLVMVRNAGSPVPRCLLPRARTFVDFAVPWNTYLFRLGISMFPPGVERAVLHADGPLTAVCAALIRSEIPESVRNLVIVAPNCTHPLPPPRQIQVDAEDDKLEEDTPPPRVDDELAQMFFTIAQRAAVAHYKVTFIGTERVLARRVDPTKFPGEIATAVGPYFDLARPQLDETLAQLEFTSTAEWYARTEPSAQLEAHFEQ